MIARSISVLNTFEFSQIWIVPNYLYYNIPIFVKITQDGCEKLQQPWTAVEYKAPLPCWLTSL